MADPPADTLAGLKLPDTPAGRPLMASAMLCGTPDVTAVDTVTTRLVPRASVSPTGNAAMEKSFGIGAATVTPKAAVCVPLTAVPVSVTLALPSAAADDAIRVTVAEPPAATLAGLTLPDTPAGSPLSDNDTGCIAPDVTAVPRVTVRVVP